MTGPVEPGGTQRLLIINCMSKSCSPSFAFVVQTDGLLPSASDFITSGDESGGGKSGAQRKRSLKDKPRKSRMRKEEDADVETASPGMLHVPYWHKSILQTDFQAQTHSTTSLIVPCRMLTEFKSGQYSTVMH